MTNEFLRYYKPNVIITVIAILAIAVFSGVHYWKLSVSVISIITGILILNDLWLWKYPPFAWMFWIEDFSGRYEGFLEYEYRDEKCNVLKDTLKHVKIISQSGSKITIYSFTWKKDGTPSTYSVNKGMYVEKIDGGIHYQLIYNYLNDGNKELEFPPHYGTEIIKFSNDNNEKEIFGRYYTERLPYQTHGKFVNMRWVNNKMKHDF
jgi:hypothetical protein